MSAFLSHASIVDWSVLKQLLIYLCSVIRCYQESLPHVGHISRDVELRTWIEVILSTDYRWTQTLVLHSAKQRKRIIITELLFIHLQMQHFYYTINQPHTH